MKVLLGFGLGIVLTSTLLIFKPPGALTDYQVEDKARALGMAYPQEVLLLEERDAEDAEGGDTEDSPGNDGFE